MEVGGCSRRRRLEVYSALKSVQRCERRVARKGKTFAWGAADSFHNTEVEVATLNEIESE